MIHHRCSRMSDARLYIHHLPNIDHPRHDVHGHADGIRRSDRHDRGQLPLWISSENVLGCLVPQ